MQKLNFSYLKKFAKIVEWVVFFMLCLLFVTLFAQVLPTKTFFSTYSIASGSMEPAIKKGSMVFVLNNPNKVLEPGQVIAFESPSDPKSTIVHRLVATSGEGLVTKGDNNRSKDDWVLASSNVKGVIVFWVPLVGYISAKVSTAGGFALFIGVPALLLLFLQLKKIYEGIEEEIQKRTAKEINKRLGNSNTVSSIW